MASITLFFFFGATPKKKNRLPDSKNHFSLTERGTTAMLAHNPYCGRRSYVAVSTAIFKAVRSYCVNPEWWTRSEDLRAIGLFAVWANNPIHHSGAFSHKLWRIQPSDSVVRSFRTSWLLMRVVCGDRQHDSGIKTILCVQDSWFMDQDSGIMGHRCEGWPHDLWTIDSCYMTA